LMSLLNSLMSIHSHTSMGQNKSTLFQSVND
jgi:hypothetical protein